MSNLNSRACLTRLIDKRISKHCRKNLKAKKRISRNKPNFSSVIVRHPKWYEFGKDVEYIKCN